jgi:uncharacterized protein
MKTNCLSRTILIFSMAITLFFAGPLVAAQKGRARNSKEVFFKAVTEGQSVKVKAMLKKDPSLASAADDKGVTALLKAVYYGKKEVIELLQATGMTLTIFEASATGKTDRVNELIRQDKSLLKAYSPDGFYPLGLAIFFAHQETAEALLRAGADVNQVAKNAMKVAPLHSAAAGRQLEIARRLLELGASVNARQEGELTALHEVAATGQLEFARLLLTHGADVNALTSSGKTPTAFAVAAGQKEMAELLRQHGGKK